MRLVVMGQQAFGKDALSRVLAAGKDEVVAVYCEPDKNARPADPIKACALENGLPVLQPPHFDDAATLDELASHQADLMIMAFVNVFVPAAARDAPKQGSICFHPLPASAAPWSFRCQLADHHGARGIGILMVLPDRWSRRRRHT